MNNGWVALALMVAITVVGLWLQRWAVRKEAKRRRERWLAAVHTFGYQQPLYEPGPHVDLKAGPATHFVAGDLLRPEEGFKLVPFEKEQSCPTSTR